MLSATDLQRLVEIITEEVMAAQNPLPASTPSQCACHAVLYECCPDRLRGVLDAGATRIAPSISCSRASMRSARRDGETATSRANGLRLELGFRRPAQTECVGAR